MRAALLGAAGNQPLQRFITHHGRRFGAYRFVAGETLDEFIAAVRSANARGMRVAAGLLGEDVRSRDAAAAVAREYCDMLDRFALDRVDANVALKLTHLGLTIDRDLALANVAAVAARAAEHGNFVRMDMEQSAHTDATLDIYRGLRARGVDNVGAVLQSYLYRSEADLLALLPLNPSLRIVKGAYLESASVAYARKRDVEANYVKLLELCLHRGRFTAIATHDDAIIDHAVGFVERESIGRDRFEFQMLYGVRPKLQSALVARGFDVRIAVPFGSQWYPYFMRRLAERPANVLFLLRSMWRG
ncbi:MAG: proline dehydrogenase family protein [Candidatus Eremiobacteraeota bacterium]|nr:proline dehydrogenase family protein [Candidatus Eremiobacteraeota bacterium]